MKTLVLGCGNIGSVAAEDLAKSTPSTEIVVADNERKRAKEVAEKIDTSNVSWVQLNVTDDDELIKTLRDFDIVMGFLPGKLGYRLAEACIETSKDLVDVSYMAENPLTLNGKALRAGVTIVPDCGLAPGISNFLVGHAIRKLDAVQAVHIMVGGLPEKPVPPLGYTITWSPESLIDEYTRKAGIVRKGKKFDVEPLTGLEEIDFPHVGKFEAFFTDGLRTLMHTVRNVDDMWEKTLRYPGHAEKIKTLEGLGFFDEKQVDIENVNVSPRKVTVKLLKQKLWKPNAKDIVALKVEVSGVRKGKQTSYVYHMLDRQDEKNAVTAMARTTAYPASIVTQLMLKNKIKEKGVVPPEKLGANESLFKLFLGELEKRGIRINEQT